MRGVLITLGTVVVGGSAVLVVGSLQLDQTPFDDAPGTIKACGHTYVNPSDQGIQRRDVDARGLVVQKDVWTWQGKRSVWTAPDCGSEAYLRVSANDFRGYNRKG